MCGIAGLIGKSKKPELSHALITQLFSKTESRGKDASGYWGVGTQNNILYNKEGIRASEFVKKQFWQDLKEQNPSLLLTHCRSISPGAGSAETNSNNHPFVSSCKNIGLIHNGNIVRESKELRKSYEVMSECDSEVLLRIFESQEDQLQGISDIWSFIHEGSMAVAIGERESDLCRLWIFRNNLRDLWLVDLRQELGQLFFFSDPDIWEQATSTSNLSRFTINDFIELPTKEIWTFQISESEPIVTEENWWTYGIEVGEKSPWKSNGKKIPIKKMDYIDSYPNQENDLFDENLSIEEVEEHCHAISDMAADIEVTARNHLISGYNSLSQLDELSYQLQKIRNDMEYVLKIMSS